MREATHLSLDLDRDGELVEPSGAIRLHKNLCAQNALKTIMFF